MSADPALPPTVVVRAEVNPQIGTGHLMRCLALTDLWIRTGHSVVVAVDRAPATLLDRIGAIGATPVVLADGHDPDAVLGLVTGLGATGLVVDGRTLDVRYRNALHGTGVPVLALDDGITTALAADIVLNSSPLADVAHYASVAPDARLLLGPRYAPLRREFTERARGSADGDRILVTFGGSDPLGLTAPVTAALAATTPADVTIDVLVGAATTPTEIEDVARRHGHRIVVHSDLRRPSTAMINAGVAVSAAGSTLWELAYLGVPTLAVAVSVDQAITLAEPLAGWFGTIDGRTDGRGDGHTPVVAQVVAQVADRATRLWSNPAERAAARRRLLAVDVGTGIGELADIFCSSPMAVR